MWSTYDQWKTRTPWDSEPNFYCSACEDWGCRECSEPQMMTMEDLDEMCGTVS